MSDKKFYVLFICTGNTCRSPMAEVYFGHLCKQKGLRHISASSAGIHGANGCSASPMAKLTVEKEGLSLENFRSIPVTSIEIKRASIIICMTAEHVRQLISSFPHAQKKIYLLTSFAEEGHDIKDPHGGDYNNFKDCFDKMKPSLKALLNYIIPLSPFAAGNSG